jgi:uncharacterized membrane protein
VCRIDHPLPDELLVTAAPNRSLTPSGALVLSVAASLVCLLISLAFAWFGAWVVVPFAGLEALVFTCLLAWVVSRRHVEERLRLTPAALVLEREAEGLVEQHVFQPYWTQVLLAPGHDAHARLLLRSHGRDLEFGRHLSDQEKTDLARELRRHLGGLSAHYPARYP